MDSRVRLVAIEKWIKFQWEEKHVIRVCFALFVGLLLGLFASCSDKPDGPDNKPEPYYKLHFGYTDPKYTVLVFNTKTGEVIDSVYYPDSHLDAQEFTSDGRYACYGKARRGQNVWVTRNPQGDTIAIREYSAWQLQISRDDKYLLFTGREGLRILTLPDLAEVTSDLRGIQVTLPKFDRKRKLAYYGVDPIDSLYLLNFEASPFTVSRFPMRTISGSAYFPSPLATSPDGKLLFIAGDMLHPVIQVLDTDSLRVVQELRLDTDTGWVGIVSPTWHPDGNRLFFAGPSSAVEPPVGIVGINVYDLQTRTLSTFLSKDEVDLDSGYFNPVDLAFTPDGKKLFVAVFEPFSYIAVLQFDMGTRSYERTLFSGHGYYTTFTLDPTPYYK